MSAFIKTEALVFDWGNTVMKEFAEFHGAMVDWPRVEAVPGVVQALKELQPRFHLFLGSNAQNSGADQIKRALKRVNLEGFFEAIFTFNETKARKPEIGFYRAIEQLTSCSNSHMVMIGDLYDKDICGAKQAGWKAVWYNPGCAPCTGCLPMHDIELYDMKALPAALKEPTYPGVETCLLWMQQNGATAHLLIHVQLVAAIAYQLSELIRATGRRVNPILAHRGGLLHDVAKANNTSELDHGQAGAKMLEQLGEPALAKIADHHMLFTLLGETRAPTTWEEKVVYYADKLVEKNEVVSVDERLAGLQERYNIDSNEMMNELTPRIKELEAEICGIVGATPDELLGRLRKGLRS